MMEWIKVKLTDISNPKQWKNLPMSELTDSGYLVYGANGIIGKYKEYNHEHPTLAITCRGATCGTINITEPKSYITSNAMALDDLSKNVDQKFLYYALRKRGFKDVISGSAQPQITREGLTKVILNIPKYKIDQIRIATVLSKVDHILAQRKESVFLLDQFLKSVFLEMFGERNIKRKDWMTGKIKDLVDEVKYGTSKPAVENGKFPYLRMNNITYQGYMDYSDLKSINIEPFEEEKYVVKKGDLLFNRTNSKELVGKTGIFNKDEKMVIAGYLIRVRTNERGNPWFIWGYLNSIHGKKVLQSMCKSIVGMANINAQEFQNINLVIPPVNLQEKFAQIVEKTEVIKSQYQQSLCDLEILFASLNQKAFKGELDLSKVYVEDQQLLETADRHDSGIEETKESQAKAMQFNWSEFLKKHFAEKPVTTEEAEKVFNADYSKQLDRNFHYEEFGEELFEELKKHNSLLTQRFNPDSKQIEITLKK